MAQPDTQRQDDCKVVTAILAGGLATRLGYLSATLPKSLIQVGGEPFLAHQLRGLAAQGLQDVVLCAGHLGEKIAEFAGDGSRFGCRVRYSFDGERLLGTGGALLRAAPLLGERFLVMYGDSYLRASIAPIWKSFVEGKKAALMTVFRNEGRWDRSNVEFCHGEIVRYDKAAPPEKMAAMRHIDYGLGCIRREALLAWAGERECFDLASFYRAMCERGDLAGFEVKERFYEIGSLTGLAETDALLSGRCGPEGPAE
jgi:NDP-sugar pyrophosphorylase family protein